MTHMFSCAGQVAIVTGGATGIGWASAAALAQAGARVVIAGLPSTDPDAAAARLRSAGADAVGVDLDVTDANATHRLVAGTVERWGRVDTVLANAGAVISHEAPLAALDEMFDLHVRSVVRLADTVLPTMARGGGGTFIVMSSLSGLRGNRHIGDYGITKAANAQLVRNLAVQWGPQNIRANALSPGVIETDLARPITGDSQVAAARLSKTPLGRFGRPEEVASAVVWLASPGGAFVSGQNIVIDGGTLISDQ